MQTQETLESLVWTDLASDCRLIHREAVFVTLLMMLTTWLYTWELTSLRLLDIQQADPTP